MGAADPGAGIGGISGISEPVIIGSSAAESSRNRVMSAREMFGPEDAEPSASRLSMRGTGKRDQSALHPSKSQHAERRCFDKALVFFEKVLGQIP